MGQLIRLYYLAIATSLLLSPSFLSAQQRSNEQYKKYAAQVQQEIWGWDIPAFKNPNPAAADSKASAVVLAKHEEIKATTQKKLRGISLTVIKDLIYISTLRQMVKINDKAALDEYSELSYQQFESSNAYFKWRGATTIIGARILKPDGKIREVNIDEAVQIKDERNDKQRKLAIPDLQVGDVLDYFIRVEKQTDTYNEENELFVFGDDKPIQHYSVHCEFTDQYAIEYRSMNGAPEFKVKRNEDDDIIMDIEMKNIPARPISLWMSPYRQLPIVRMNVMKGGVGKNSRRSGEVYRNPEIDQFKDDVRLELAARNQYSLASQYHGYIEDQIKLYNREHKTKLPKDSIPYFVYYGLRYMFFYRVKPQDPIVVDQQRNYWAPKDNWFIYYLARVFNGFDIPHEIVLATSKYGAAQQDVMSAGDYVYLVRTKTDKPVLMGSDGVFTEATEIPYQFEGQKAPTVDTRRLKVDKEHDNEVPVTISESKAADNVHTEKLSISLESNMQQALVKRTTTLKGHMREDGQKPLLLFEDYYDVERRALSVKESFMEEFADSRRNRSLAEEYTNAFEKARKGLKERFTKEISSQFDQDPKELKEFHIEKMGLRHTDPDFVYTTEFTMDGWIKKAGNNYILDAGKLIGGQLQLKPEQRKRQVDIYMPFARTLDYDIELLIPAGYQLEGVDQLNQQVDNDCGSFIVSASTAQNKLVLHVKKVYKHAFEPAAKWPDILKVLDAATDFGSRKLLLKKA
jgi:hypothetical protein